jgi:hypothetical protein
MSTQRRVYYACQAVGIAPESTATYSAIKGLQSVGITTSFNLEQVFEIGMLSIYENIENLPDVEVTLEKVLDGNPLIYHMATQGSLSADLGGRSNKRCGVALSVFTDTQAAASGTPLAQCVMSGLFIQQVSYAFKTDGPFTESCTLVGNNKKWQTSAFTFTGGFTTTEIPAAVEGVNRRYHFDMYTSRFPKEIPGITGSGTYTQVAGLSQTVFQGISTSVNLGREALLELGRRGPYFRFATFPVEVTCEIEVLMTTQDGINADENALANVTNQAIYLKTSEGTKVDLGTKNKLSRVVTGGGNAGGGGNNNVTLTYSYSNFNDMIVIHTGDPTVALRG